ncbi:MAG: peptidase M2 [Pirellulaceae bacterium]|nr:MAG: peptidase M2 [Pirellulaceae bacterium]
MWCSIRSVLWPAALGAALFGTVDRSLTAKETEALAREFIAEHERLVRPLEIEVGRAWWQANISGSDADFQAKQEAQNRLDAALADRDRFARLKALHEAEISDPLLKRQIHLLYLMYLEKQVDKQLLERITAKANAIEKAFNVYRPVVNGRQMTDSEVRRVLAQSKDSGERQAVWQASKGVGQVVAADLRELVLLRNEAARQLGFPNYHTMQLVLTEHDPQQIVALFDQLDQLTREPFAEVKRQIDQALAESYGISVEALRPWHYHDPFFQEAPKLATTNFDPIFADVNIVDVCRRFYAGIGLPVDDVLQNSDLFEKPGKSPHAFCIDIDREGDVRVLANIVPTEYWMTTMLHELGHAVYSSKFIPRSLPYVLRTESHILTTEGVAMMFERFAGSATWLRAMGVHVPDAEAFERAARQARRQKLLIFSRWCQVMLRFEKSMYENPDQDLNRLWWDLVERYQLVRRPENRDAPDYASKIHIVSAPCYYHNYMLGELFACQLHQAIAREVLKADDPVTAVYYDDPRVGQFMRDRVFRWGRLLSWNDLTRAATGAPLAAEAFAAEFARP